MYPLIVQVLYTYTYASLSNSDAEFSSHDQYLMTILKQSNKSGPLPTSDITPKLDPFLYIPRIFLIKRKSILEEGENFKILEKLQRSSDLKDLGR